MNLLSVWWFKAVPMHPSQANPGELCLIETQRWSGATAPRAGLPAKTPWQWNLGSLQPKSASGKQLMRRSHPVSTQHFLSLHRACRRTAFVLLCHHPVLRSKYKINFFSVSHTLSSKKFKVLVEQYPKPPPVVSFIAQGWELWPDGKVFALKRGYSKTQRKPIFLSLPTSLFWLQGSCNTFSHKCSLASFNSTSIFKLCCKGYEYKANTPGPQSSVRITIWHK